MSASFSPQLIGVSRLRSSAVRKLPEPLRRSVADCLSSPLASSANEPSRTLRVNSHFAFQFRFSFGASICEKFEIPHYFRQKNMLFVFYFFKKINLLVFFVCVYNVTLLVWQQNRKLFLFFFPSHQSSLYIFFSTETGKGQFCQCKYIFFSTGLTLQLVGRGCYLLLYPSSVCLDFRCTLRYKMN